MTMTAEQEKEMRRAEGLKAHAKMREEVRTAVREAMFREGISREEIRKAIRDTIKADVKDRVAGMKIDMDKEVDEFLRDELKKVVGATYTVEAIKKVLRDRIDVMAKEFVDSSVLIRVNNKEMW